MSIPPPPSSGHPEPDGPGRGTGHPGPPRHLPPPDDPLVPADLRGWFERIARVTQRSAVPLLTIQLVAGVVGAALSLAMNQLLPVPGPPTRAPAPTPGVDPDTGLLILVLGLMVAGALGTFAQAASTYVAVQDAAGRPSTASEGFRFAARLAPALLPWGLAAGVLTVAGLMLILPGLYLFVVFGASLIGVLTIERGHLPRCFALVNRRLWPTVGRMALTLGAVAGYGIVSGLLTTALSAPRSIAEVGLSALLAVPMGMVAVGVTTVTYAELRFHEQPGVLTPTLARELNQQP